MSKINLQKYTPTKTSILLLDTNVLIHLFYPIMSHSYMEPYQRFFAEAKTKSSIFLLSAIQVSEFINRCIRFHYELYKQEHSLNDFEYKRDYRNTEDYHENMEALLDIVKNDILCNFHVVNDNFSEMNPDRIYIYGFSYDFNDALLVQIAEKEKACIVTHDADFANYKTNVDFISFNQKLLMFS